jgi:seryl-tRNA synthetase
MPEPIVVVAERTPEELPPQDGPGLNEAQFNQAERFGELLAEVRQLQTAIAEMQSRINSNEASATEVTTLRAEVARLTALLEEVEEEIEETESDVTVITPPLPPTPEPEPEPPKKAKGFWEKIGFGEM